jgi:poly(3-hydroxybutyrate) depolymerase
VPAVLVVGVAALWAVSVPAAPLPEHPHQVSQASPAARTATPRRASRQVEDFMRVAPPGRTVTLRAAGRPFALHLPPGGHGRPLPVVLALPGLNTAPVLWDTMARLAQHADTDGFAVAYASGTQGSFDARVCCGAALRDHVDDEGYLVAIRRTLVALGIADPAAVYLLGFSNGDMLGLMAVCHHPDLFAAEAGSSGDFPYAAPQRCTGARVLHLHGSGDTVIPAAGGWNAALGMRSLPIATLPRRMAGARVTVRYLPCGHLFPTPEDPCGFDGVAAAWAFFRS